MWEKSVRQSGTELQTWISKKRSKLIWYWCRTVPPFHIFPIFPSLILKMTSSHPLDSIIHQICSYKSNFLSYARYFVSGQYGRIICHSKELEKLNGNSVLAMAIRCYIMCIESDGWLLVIFKIREGNMGKMWNGGTVLNQYPQ